MRWSNALVVVVGVAGCAPGLATTPKPDAAVSWAPQVAAAEAIAADAPLGGVVHAIPGEEMEYEIRLRGITVGQVQVVVGQPGELDGRRVLIVRSRGSSAGVVTLLGELRWEMTTTIDLETGHAVAEDEEFTAVLPAGKKKHEHKVRDWTHDDDIHNIHSAAAALRAWRSAPEDNSWKDVHIGSTVLEIDLNDTKREMIGATPAVRYDGTAADKFPMAIWISDDVARVPLRVHTATKFGDIDVELVHYEAPRDL